MTTRPIPALERDYQRTILGAAKVLGWRSAHFRPGRTAHGWRTAVEGDGAGFPDLLLVHPAAGFVWFVEVKRDDNRILRPDQNAWRLALIAAGAVHRVVLVPSGLDPFLDDLKSATATKVHARPEPLR
jgi:hypothetical protein